MNYNLLLKKQFMMIHDNYLLTTVIIKKLLILNLELYHMQGMDLIQEHHIYLSHMVLHHHLVQNYGKHQ
ncbi:MAG: hypothetical protein ACI8RD_007851 [Bacillariaceae sp.]|jgi:hypothetical protein